MAVNEHQDADPRIYLAAERTLLSWVRTGLAMMGFGFVLARFGMVGEVAMPNGEASQAPDWSRWTGMALLLSGVCICLGASWAHYRTVVRLDRNLPLRFKPISIGVIVAVSLAMIGLLVSWFLIWA